MIQMIGLALLACAVIFVLWAWTTLQRAGIAPIVTEASAGPE